MGEVSPVSSGGVFPVEGRTVEQALQRTKPTKPPSVPISSIQMQTMEPKKTSVLMQAKAMSAFSVKTATVHETMAQMRPAMAGVGGMFVGVNVPIGVLNTYSLVKNWDDLSWTERSLKGTDITGNLLLTGAGTALLLSKVPALSKLVGMKASMGAGKMAFILGPIGMGLFSVASLARGAIAAKKAIQLYKAGDKQGAKRAAWDAIRMVLIGVGIGLGAFVMSGIIAGSLVTPFGWLAVGLVGAGLVITVGMILMHRDLEKGEEG